jgi:hypothetical protein
LELLILSEVSRMLFVHFKFYHPAMSYIKEMCQHEKIS